MSYYCNITGYISFKDEASPEKIRELLKDAPFEYVISEIFPSTIGIDGFSKYYEDSYDDTFESISPYVKEGEIMCSGEDGFNWRFIFNGKKFIEENADIVYESEMKSIKRMRNALREIVKREEFAISASGAAALCRDLGLTKEDMKSLNLEYLTDLQEENE